KRPPRHPEAADGGDDGDVDLPQAVGLLGGDPALRSIGRRYLGTCFGRLRGWRRGAWRWPLRPGPLEHPSDGGDAEVQGSPREQVGDLLLAQFGEVSLELLDGPRDEVRVAIDGRSESKEGARALVIESSLPVGDGGRRDQEAPGTLRM